MAPVPAVSAKIAVSPDFTTMDGLTFQPRPRYLAAFWPVPVVAMPPLPRSPVGFSGEIERVSALEVRYRVESVADSPSEDCATAGTPVTRPRIRTASKDCCTVFAKRITVSQPRFHTVYNPPAPGRT